MEAADTIRRMKALLEKAAPLTESELEDLRDELEATDEFVSLLLKRVKALEKQVDTIQERLEFHGLM